MKKFTVTDLATILQLDDSIKEDLRKNFDKYDDQLKYEILSLLWNKVHELKNRLAKLKYKVFLLEVDDGKRKLTTDLYRQAVKVVWQDFDDMLGGKKKTSSQAVANQQTYQKMKQARDEAEKKEEEAVKKLTEKLKSMTTIKNR